MRRRTLQEAGAAAAALVSANSTRGATSTMHATTSCIAATNHHAPWLRRLSHAFASTSGSPAFAIAVQQRGFAASSFKDALFNAPAKPLTSLRQLEAPAETGVVSKLLLSLGGYYSRESRLLRGARAQYDAVLEQVGNQRFREAVGLAGGEFPDTHALLVLHVWLLLHRLRAEGKDGRRLAQMTYELFTDDVEMRVRGAGVQVRLSKHLQELEKMFYGSSMAYDKALGGEAGEALSTALLRNVYGGDAARSKDAAVLERYVKRELACLGLTPSEDLLSGQLRFSVDLGSGSGSGSGRGD